MNPQPSEFVGNFFATLFCICIVVYAIKSYKLGNSIDIHNLDMITLGYIEDNPIITPVATINNFESQQLYVDCIDALHALGMKKSEAKKRAKLIFSTCNPQPENVQAFLMLALKN
ncbi:hypothetical protein EB001_01865 [bacterium]|jgi:hypothetical protein|nr:hypothetical protein [bacterium]